MSYYIHIDGQQYDKEIIELAEKLTSGARDGRISQDDAYALLDAVKDGNKYTDIEKATIAYTRKQFNWTDAAIEWFDSKLEMWLSAKEKA